MDRKIVVWDVCCPLLHSTHAASGCSVRRIALCRCGVSYSRGRFLFFR